MLLLNVSTLSSYIVASLLVDDISSQSDGFMTGEAAFWLKVLSTPSDVQNQLQKLEFKRNIYKAYCQLVKPVSLMSQASESLSFSHSTLRSLTIIYLSSFEILKF